MAKYKVGVGEDVWDFVDAYNAAQGGDILEFEEDYWYTLPADAIFTIDKNLIFEGMVTQNQGGGRTFNNGCRACFKIIKGAEVTFRNLWFYPSGDAVVFRLTEGGTLHLETVVLENDLADYKKCLVFADKKSSLEMADVEVKLTENGEALKFIEESTLKVKDSQCLMCNFIANNARLRFENSAVTCHNTNVLNAKNCSTVQLIESTITSQVPLEKNLPAIWLGNSAMVSENSIVAQDKYTAAISLNNRSKVSSAGDTISSFSLYDSVLYLDNSDINYGIYANQRSHIFGKNTINFKGEMEEKIDLFLSKDSSLIAEKVNVNRVAHPNFRLEEGTFTHMAVLEYSNGSVEDLNVEEAEGSRFIKGTATTVPTPDAEFGEDEQDAMVELQNMIGLHQVKKTIEVMVNQVAANKKRIDRGLKPLQQTLNAVFVGNPGTGKTTVARLLGKVLFQYGALAGDEFKFIEVSEPDLISQNVGGTAIQTKKYLDQARGGVLFIDEAYTLNKKGGSINFGQEAIDTIMKYMEDYRDEIMVIFAGYTKEMDEFLKTNPGLVSRAPNRFVFEDFTADEIIQLGEILLDNDQFVLEDKAYYAKQVAKAYNQSLDKSNGRWIRNFNEALTKEQLNRVVKTDSDDIETILNGDIDKVMNQGRFEDNGRVEDAMEKLNSLIGIHHVKRQVQEFIYQVEANQKKEEKGMKVNDFTLHSLFLGNPGTGKTTVARIIGRVLYQKGIIATNKFIEASRSDLVAGYIGQTAAKTREVLESALGGVLFIDEAYTLNGAGSNDFGKEAIDEILKFMEDHRRDIVIIFAGYTKEMGEFLQMNSGLTSRIPTTFDFEDYTADEIAQIGLLGLKEYQFDKEFYGDVVKEAYATTTDRSNGRWIRNFNEKLLRIQSARLIQSGRDSFEIISKEDIENARDN
ncbi:AAA family ATPase [Streptococcus suis]|nr:AAA family ATPase [Streptococcus suis]